MSRTKFRLAAAALSAMALTSLSVAPAAFAADPTPTPVAAPNASNINEATPVSLKIHKYEGPTWDQELCPADGTVLTDPACTGTALSGAEFTVWAVEGPNGLIDLTTNAGWAEAKIVFDWWMDHQELPTGYAKVGTGTMLPTVGGVAEFTNLSKTLYIVEETKAPPSATGTYTPAAPFIVTVPMATADGTGWIYNVNAYPKNNKDTITKAVEDAQSTGSVTNPDLSTINYTVTTSISPGYVASTAPEGKVLTRYQVRDTFDLRLTPPTVDQVTVSVTGVTDPFEEGVDYTYALDGQQVTITFTQAGLDRLVAAKAADPTAKVVTVFTATLTDANCYTDPADGVVCVDQTIVDGIVTNTAEFVPNQDVVNSDGTPKWTPSNEVESKYADVQIVKTNDQATDNRLQGAEFSLYQTNTCTADGIAGLTPIGTKATDDNGQITWKSIQISTYINNVAVEQHQNYCLVETQAPVGYVLPANPYTAITLNDDTKIGLVYTSTITNMEQEGNQLPLTGGAGVAALGAGGLLLVGGGLAYYAVSSRRRREQEV